MMSLSRVRQNLGRHADRALLTTGEDDCKKMVARSCQRLPEQALHLLE
ncbi:MAG: hypothetical protein KC592_15270 [Nitrospira sp.]|nr:hypothetical protein [Nitrospira sp.]MCW5785386.1 hypothetical protein [Nitrospirales bacterium]